MFVRSIPVVASRNSLLFGIAVQYSSERIYHHLATHSIPDSHLDSF